MGKSSRPPIRKPSIPPAGPPRDSQSSIRTTQPTPIIVPNPKVKYSTVLSPPRSFAIAADYPFLWYLCFGFLSVRGPRSVRGPSSFVLRPNQDQGPRTTDQGPTKD